MSRAPERLPECLTALHRLGVLRDIDLYLLDALRRRYAAAAPSDAAWLAMGLTGAAVGAGHSCLDLARAAPDWVCSLAPSPGGELSALPQATAALCGALTSGPEPAAEGLIGPPAGAAPFVLHGGRLYLRRYWDYEQRLAAQLRARAGPVEAQPAVEAEAHIAEFFEAPAQRAAARSALRRGLTIVTGGPGTGKTFTAARLLSLLARFGPASGRAPVVRLAAPTGKAAARMDESVRRALEGLGAGALPEAALAQAATVDRLLGPVRNSPYYRHQRRDPLRADVVIVDEASMLDLPKAAKLLDALEPRCRLVLLGDMHQLASVDPGRVLADLCRSRRLSGCLIELTDSHRFGADDPVAVLGAAVRGAAAPADARRAWRALDGLDAEGLGECRLVRRDTPARLEGRGGAAAELAAAVIAGYGDFTAAAEPRRAFEALGRFRILCALRHGPFGAAQINRLVERILAGTAVPAGIPPAGPRQWRRLQPAGRFYDHRVVMVTRNDYSLGLFNGDVGIVMPDDEEPQRLVTWFEPRSRCGDLRKFACRLLPEHETAFAMTVHKAQGSEFERVLILMPAHPSPVVTRELLYTALTRTRSGAELWCNRNVFETAVLRTADRFTGLLEALDRDVREDD